MLKNIFNKDRKEVEQNMSVAPAPTAPVAPVRQYKPTKKKKNTYIVHLGGMITPGMHELCSSTPLVVVKLNGVPTENTQKAFATCTRFPNPGACQMEVLFFDAPEWRIIATDKTAQTIIEYLDKESGKPVLVLYPTGHASSLVPGMDVNTVVATRLNHASRRDFIRQYKRIVEIVKVVNPLINVRNRAMQKAPQHSSDAYAQFVTELNRLQIERARQIVAQRQK